MKLITGVSIGTIIGILLTSGVLAAASAILGTPLILWGYDNQVFDRQWVDYSGRMGIQSQVTGATGLDLWPTSNVRPQLDAYSEITVHRTSEWEDSGRMERFSMSAMATPYGNAAYRFGVEAGGGGELRDIIFCFESTGGPAAGATCPLKITQGGAFASGDGGATWHQL